MQKKRTANFIYAILFSNGMVKVGKTSNVERRIAQHAERVICIGVTIVKTFVRDCGGDGSASSVERKVIKWCQKMCDHRFSKEWFSGVGFDELCRFIDSVCQSSYLNNDESFISQWHMIVTRLCDNGMTQMSIAKECNCSQPSISDLVKGRVTDPRYSIGKKLLDMFSRIV